MSYLTENNRRNIMVGAATLFLLLFACMAAIRLYVVLVPTHVEGNTINITMADFDEALVRWKSKEPQEYTMTTVDGSDVLNLRVRPKEGEVQVVSQERGLMQDPVAVPGLPSFLTAGHDADNRTVDGLFATAKEMLELGGIEALRMQTGGETAYFRDFKIEFDPELGYPKRIEHRIRTADLLSEIVWRQYGQSTKKVEKLEIVR